MQQEEGRALGVTFSLVALLFAVLVVYILLTQGDINGQCPACAFHGTWNGTHCACSPGWCGSYCELPPCACDANFTCQNNGTCVATDTPTNISFDPNTCEAEDAYSGWECECLGEFGGTFCRTQIFDSCGQSTTIPDPCSGDEICVPLNGTAFECVCPNTTEIPFPNLTYDPALSPFQQFFVSTWDLVIEPNVSNECSLDYLVERGAAPTQEFSLDAILNFSHAGCDADLTQWMQDAPFDVTLPSDFDFLCDEADPVPCHDPAGETCNVTCGYGYCPLSSYAEPECSLGNEPAFPWDPNGFPVNDSFWNCTAETIECANGNKWIIRPAYFSELPPPPDLVNHVCICEAGWKGAMCNLVWVDDPRLCFVSNQEMPWLNETLRTLFIEDYGHEPYGWQNLVLELGWGGYLPDFDLFPKLTEAIGPAGRGALVQNFWFNVSNTLLYPGDWFGNASRSVAVHLCSNDATCSTELLDDDDITLQHPESTAPIQLNCDCNATSWSSNFVGRFCECPQCQFGIASENPFINSTNGHLQWNCLCEYGWEGPFCETACECPPGYELPPNTGPDVGQPCPACVDIDECELGYCITNCTNTPGSWSCAACPPGYDETLDGNFQKCTPEDLCSASNPCHQNRTCLNAFADPLDFWFPTLPVFEVACGACDTGFETNGAYACSPILPCNETIIFLRNCTNNTEWDCDPTVTCQVFETVVGNTTVNEFGVCGECPTGYWYADSTTSIYNYNGTCVPTNGCLAPNVNNCTDNRTCEHDPQIGPGSYYCGPCPFGTIANGSRFGCVEFNPCNESYADALCFDGRQCVRNISNPDLYSCTDCPSGYKNEPNGGCSDINECALNATLCAYLGPYGTCVNLPGSYECVCQPGFELNPSNTTCIDIDECDTPSNGTAEHCPFCRGVCVNLVGSVTCDCGAPFTYIETPWPHCEYVGDPCTGACAANETCVDVTDVYDITVCIPPECGPLDYSPYPCLNGGYLVAVDPVPTGTTVDNCPQQPTFECRCRGLWSGPSCEIYDAEACYSQGYTNPFGANDTCGCSPERHGPNCEFIYSNLTCQNGGIVREVSILSSDFANYTTNSSGLVCDCPPGFEGPVCETEIGCNVTCPTGYYVQQLNDSYECVLNCTYCPEYLHPLPSDDGVICVWALYFAPRTNGALGGLSGADEYCRLNLPDSWLTCSYAKDKARAFLTDNSGNVATRFGGISTQHSTAPIYFQPSFADETSTVVDYALFDGDGWSAIFACPGGSAACVDFSMDSIFRGIGETLTIDNSIWTGSTRAGLNTGFHCNDWTTAVAGPSGTYGATNSRTSTWINNAAQSCNNINLLVCAAP